MTSARLVLALCLGGVALAATPAAAQQVWIDQITASSQSIRQQGSGNTSTVEVSGSGHQGDIVQTGDDNRAHLVASGARARQSIRQYGSDNLGLQTSIGQGNVATLTQGSPLLPASGNVALQVQVGTDNMARIAQNGDRNAAAQVQLSGLSTRQALALASGLAADLRSGRVAARTRDLSDLGHGSNNTVELVQDGDDNLAVMVQAGDGNRMDVHQAGGGANVYMQIGDNLSRTASVEQRAGSNGVTPIMIIQSR